MSWNRIALAAAALTLTSSFAFAEAIQTITGTVTDTMCGKKHTMGGTVAECVRACVKDGSDYGLIVGDKVYTLKGDKAAMDHFAGATATVTGTTTKDTITVKSIHAPK